MNNDKKILINKPELLLPAGSPEAFIAALEGGADAIYLGLQNFNARGRAKNFQISHLPALIKKAAAYHAKIYLTLNTLIKNNELTKLLEYLTILQDYPPAAIIIQDWGVYYFLQKYFPRLKIHASTQMGNHNSLDCRYAGNQGFQRVILARELTLEEIHTIASQSRVELEVFAHGALCYSFSGSCLFSSWAGGMSANRGQCKQPCRHQFSRNGRSERWFSMKDFELIEYLPELIKLGIKAVKIEGRMRSADYVYTVAKAYRMALDNPARTSEAKQLLVEDGGRDKTDWFIPGKSEYSTTGNSFTGKGIGLVTSNSNGYLGIQLSEYIRPGIHIRFQTEDDTDSEAIYVDRIFARRDEVLAEINDAPAGQTIYLALKEQNIPIKSIVYKTKHVAATHWNYRPESTPIAIPDSVAIKQMLYKLKQQVATENPGKKTEIYYRINHTGWIPLLHKVNPAGIFIPLQAVNEHGYNPLLIPELPFFISEQSLPEFQKRVQQLIDNNVKAVCLSRLSQTIWFRESPQIRLLSSEKIYCLNDAAIARLKQSGMSGWVLPLENDFPNLLSSNNREGIIPIYFHPALFFSRQHVFSEANTQLIHNKDKLLYNRYDDEMDMVTPERAICNFNFFHRLIDKGYRRFLIDLSGDLPEAEFLNALMGNLNQGKNPEGTQRFNMKQGLW